MIKERKVMRKYSRPNDMKRKKIKNFSTPTLNLVNAKPK